MVQKDISIRFIPPKNQQQQLISNSWYTDLNCWTFNGCYPGLTTADIRATFTFTLSHFHFHIQDWRQQISVPPVCQQKRRVWHWGDQSGEKQTKHAMVVMFTFVSIITIFTSMTESSLIRLVVTPRGEKFFKIVRNLLNLNAGWNSVGPRSQAIHPSLGHVLHHTCSLPGIIIFVPPHLFLSSVKFSLPVDIWYISKSKTCFPR